MSTQAVHCYRNDVGAMRQLTYKLSSLQLLDPPSHPVVLRQVCLRWGTPRFVAVVGESGSGKTMFLRGLLGLFSPVNRSMAVDLIGRHRVEDYAVVVDGGGEVLKVEQVALRGLVGYMDQQPTMVPWRSIRRNLELPGDLNPETPGLDIESLHVYMSRVGLLTDGVRPEELLGRYPSDVSGGQLQRLVLAGLLARAPWLLLLDEATSALDPVSARRVFQLLGEYVAARGALCVMVTHEPELAREWAQEIIRLEGGRVVVPQ